LPCPRFLRQFRQFRIGRFFTAETGGQPEDAQSAAVWPQGFEDAFHIDTPLMGNIWFAGLSTGSSANSNSNKLKMSISRKRRKMVAPPFRVRGYFSSTGMNSPHQIFSVARTRASSLPSRLTTLSA